MGRVYASLSLTVARGLAANWMNFNTSYTQRRSQEFDLGGYKG